MRILTGRRFAACLLLSLTLVATACRGDSNDDAAKSTTTSTSTSAAETTTTTVAGAVATTTTAAGATATTTAGKSPAKTTTTIRIVATPGATVNDAPRDEHSEKTDNSGTLTYSASPTNVVGPTERPPNDPLEFTLSCTVAADGHGACHLILVNHVTRTAQFPGGLKIMLAMQRSGAAPIEFAHALNNVTSLRAGERAEVDATFDLTEHGTYSYSATTTIAWP